LLPFIKDIGFLSSKTSHSYASDCWGRALMTQREQNGNCFCSRAAMRQQQSLKIPCDTLVAAFISAPPSLYDFASSQRCDPA
jgi:hypothetical protein